MTYSEVAGLVAEFLNRTDLSQNCGLAEGTNANTIKTVTAINYWIAANRYTKAVTDNIAMTACAQQAISTFCLYLVSINAAGTVTITKGTSVATNTAQLPAVPTGQAPIGAFKVATDGSTTFTSGTTDLSAAGLTVTFYDIDNGPLRKIINMVQRKLERTYNFRHMRVRTTSTIGTSTHTIDNPITNYKSMISCFVRDTNGVHHEVERVSYDDAMRLFPDLTDDIGRPVYVSEISTLETALTPDASPTFQLLFRPTNDTSGVYIMDLYAYQYSPDIEGVNYSTNWWTANAPEVLLYGALVEMEAYMVNDTRIGLWKQMYDEAVKRLIDAEIDEVLSGSPQQVRSEYVV